MTQDSNSPSAKAAQQIAREAASKIDDFIEHHNGFSGRIAPIQAIIQDAIAASLRARDAEIEGLRKYVHHKPNCLARRTDNTECDCGLAALITKEQPKS